MSGLRTQRRLLFVASLERFSYFGYMTIEAFLDLTESEQAKAVWEGTYIAFREEDDVTVMRYKVADFYVDVFYHKIENVMLQFSAFNSEEALPNAFQSCLN